MYPHICHVFINGAYLRVESESSWDKVNVHPLNLANKMVGHPTVQGWASVHSTTQVYAALMGRVTYLRWTSRGQRESRTRRVLAGY